MSYRFAAEGTFTVLLTVTDNAGRQDRHSLVITVRGTPPVARLACPTVLGEAAAHLGQWQATFDASDSYDDVAIITYAWDFGDHTTGTGIRPSHSYTALGTYTVTLTVTDGAGQQSTATCAVTVTRGAPPLANAGGPYAMGEAAAHVGTWTVTLDGRGSQDDVALTDYTWTFADSVYAFTGTTINPQEWLVSPGVTQANALTVTGAAAWDNRYLFSARSFPRASQPVFEARIRPGATDGSQAAMWGLKHSNTFNWAYTAMPHALYFSNSSLFIFEDGVFKASVGTYTLGTLYDVRITLHTQGARYEMKPATASTWTLLYESTTSVATLLRVGMTVFTGTFTVDNVQVSTVQTGPVATATYHAPGTYPVTPRVRDNALQESTATTTVTVSAGAPPVARAGGPYAMGPDRLGQFVGSASTDDVGIARYRWDFGDGTVQLEPNPVHQYVTPGTYTATLTVSDHAMQSATATTTVNVGWVTRVDTTGVTVDGRTRLATGTVLVELQNATAFGPLTVHVFEDTNGNARWDPGVDTLLGETTQPGLAAGATVQLQIPVTGTVSFPGVPLVAFLDTGPASASDARAYGVSQQTCRTRPTVGQLTPTLAWQWTGSTLFPTSKQVMMTPAVIDLNGDGVPDIIFATFAGGDYTQGVLRAISGQDGRELFTVTDPETPVNPIAQLAVGDLDGDGRLTIVAVAATGNQLLAFAAAGSFRWRSPILGTIGDGGPALADLDGDGLPEIIVGATVLNHDGSVRWTGTRGRGDNSFGPLSLVANLDLMGPPEIVAGNTAYRADGTLYWQQSSVPDGFNAIGNFNADPFPEIVLVTRGTVYLLAHDGAIIWGPVAIPGGGGGPPTVGDVDGDGVPEIGVAGSQRYTVFRANGTILWSQPTQDLSSGATGSAMFDFDGDGKMEVIYGDERMLRIYRGTDGAVLWETPSPSGTVYELPVIVDVDGDGRADIVKVSNNYAFPGSTGIQVYRDATNSWMPTRAVWNQHTYHVTNVNDDGSIPRNEAPSWQIANTYRRNLPSSGTLLPFPDLTASFVRLTQEASPATLTARLGNGGAFPAPAGIAVAFYDGDPSHGGILLGRATTTAPLAAGAFTDVTLQAPVATSATVWVVADDPDTVQECREDNNAVDSGLRIHPNQPPVARVGGPYTVAEGTALTLDGTGSSDPDGDPLTYTWDLTGAGVFGDATGPTATVTFPDNGTMPIALRVSDGHLTHTASTTVTVTNVAPVVTLGAAVTLAVSTPFSQAGQFRDPGLETWTATVDYGDGSGAQPLPMAPDATFALAHTYTTPSTYTVTVTVMDDAGGSGQATQTLTVFQPNRPPVAVAGGPYTVAEGAPLTLDGSTSYDPDGDPLTYAWDLTGNGVFDDASGSTPTVTFRTPGTVVVALQVSDGVLTHTSITTVTVANVAPVVTLGPDRTVTVGTLVTTTGAFSDPGAETWLATVDYGDGSGGQPLALAADHTFALAHAYALPGRYAVTVTVTDSAGGSGQAALTVTVVQAPRAPLAVARGPATVPQGTRVTLDGTSSLDRNGEALAFTWSQVAGPAVPLSDPSSATPTFTAPLVDHGGATLTFQLIVSDLQLASPPAVVNVQVTNVNHPPVAVASAPAIVQAGSLVRLDGTASYDPDHDPLTFAWRQTTEPAVVLRDPAAAQPVFTAPAVGASGATLAFQLTVSDGLASAIVTVQVAAGNQPPVASAGAPQTVDEGSRVTLDGTASADPDGDPLTFTWTQVAGLPVTLSDPHRATPTFSAPLVSAGGATLRFQLIVSDGQAPSAPATVTLTVRDVNAPPTCAQAQAQPARLWPPNHQLVAIALTGVTDPQHYGVTLTVTGVTQNEPVNGLGDGDTSPDAVLQGATVLVRAERAGTGPGRVYHLQFTADDGHIDGHCTGVVTVCVPHSAQATCVDPATPYDATRP